MRHEAIIAHAREETLSHLQDMERVLLVQDTVSFNFSHHPATDGMGPLENSYARGFLAHNTLAVHPDGVPLGLLAQHVWARDFSEDAFRTQLVEYGLNRHQVNEAVRLMRVMRARQRQYENGAGNPAATDSPEIYAATTSNSKRDLYFTGGEIAYAEFNCGL